MDAELLMGLGTPQHLFIPYFVRDLTSSETLNVSEEECISLEFCILLLVLSSNLNIRTPKYNTVKLGNKT